MLSARTAYSGYRSGAAVWRSQTRVLSAVPPQKHQHGAHFPDFVEHWTPTVFRTVGGAMAVGALGTFHFVGAVPGVVVGGLTALYWKAGLDDMSQSTHAIRRNFPVLGRVRYLFESLRPEIQQYFIESDTDATPFDRQHRSVAYQRAKSMVDTLPFGTRRDVYHPGYECATQSLFPKTATEENSRVTFGGPACSMPYSASIFNISGMSYGALSDAAILALSQGAKLGNFWHNTGEGGMSRFHIEGGGDLVWNVGTGYFGCGSGTDKRVFDPVMFKDNASYEKCRMIELKLSQGAKPGHGGMLPAAKITPHIAEARGLAYPPIGDCNSPPSHSSFENHTQMAEFIGELRELSGGKPVGLKMCLGRREEFIEMCEAFRTVGVQPDFITVDGSEGGTGAAPPEFSNSVGVPLIEALTFINSVLIGFDQRADMKVIASGKALTGFSLVRNMALGADTINSARGMMFALGCIQSLKCNTNRCPTGVATSDRRLMAGLDVEDKSFRVMNFHKKTVHSALEITGALGYTTPADIRPGDVLRRHADGRLLPLNELYPLTRMERGALLGCKDSKEMAMLLSFSNIHAAEDREVIRPNLQEC